jgi:hypothetical protein
MPTDFVNVNPAFTTKPAWLIRAGERIGLGGIDEIRVEFAKEITGNQVILVGDVFKAGVCGSFQPGYVLVPVSATFPMLGTF